MYVCVIIEWHLFTATSFRIVIVLTAPWPIHAKVALLVVLLSSRHAACSI